MKNNFAKVNNYITLYGKAVDCPKLASVDKKGKAYFKFYVEVERESGTVDTLPIIVEEDTEAYNGLVEIDEWGEIAGVKLAITGEVRTRNLKNGKLDISVRAFTIAKDNDYVAYTNFVIIKGYVCKQLKLRMTPRGITIADVLIAVNRTDGSNASDYIPAIMWNGTAKRAKKKLNVGDYVEVEGRLQSREYIKELEDGRKEIRTCYELSINGYESIPQTMNNKSEASA